MSRSRRKNPITTVACCRTSEMKEWKKACNRAMRRNINIDDDIGNNSAYKKIYDIWNSPSDGKMRHDNKKKWGTKGAQGEEHTDNEYRRWLKK